MSQQWTPEQRLAITARGGQILVSAAAGSGKTAVLVERIVSLITDERDPVDADRLLVVTFTNAAAAEMAARIRARLAELAAARPDDRRLRRQQQLLMRAQISTIDAFCSALLRAHFSELELPPDFSVGNDAQIAQLRAAAMEETLAELYARPESGIAALSDLFGRSRSDRATAELIERLYDFETNLAYPARWEQQCLDELAPGTPPEETRAGGFLLDYASRALASAVSLCAEALELAAEDEKLLLNYGEPLRCDMLYAKRLLAAMQAGVWADCAALAGSYTPGTVGRKHGADILLREQVKSLRAQVQEILERARDCFGAGAQSFEADRETLREPAAALFVAKAQFARRLDEAKRARRVYEFSDLERMAVALLGGESGEPSPVAQELAGRFVHIFVDEYQDTNEIQDLIFSLISRGERNLFCVGDVKQSIYSFRRADPELFIRRRAACRPSEQGLFPMRITLAENFRSSGPVVRAVNAVFAPVMTAQTGGTDYARGEALAAGLEAAGVPNPEPCGLDVWICPEGEEPARIAREIAGMLRRGYPVQDKAGERPCRPADFCILLRAPRDRAQAYQAALEAAGVRAWSDGAENLFENSEVAVLLSLLRVIDNPRRDVDLAAVMLSPLFGFTTDDLARLRLRDRHAQLYTLVLGSGDPKCRALVGALAAFRARSSACGVDELLRQAADETDAELLLCAGAELTRRQNNIRLFIDMAAEFSRTADGSLPAFLRLCESAAQSGKTVRRAFTPPDDAVCVTSIHNAKGREWPVVFVANAGKRFNLSDSRAPSMLFDARLGIGARVRQPCADGSALYARRTAAYQALSLASAQKTVGEEMRVLYVALTRARQKLYLAAENARPDRLIESLQNCFVNGALDPYIVGAHSGYLAWTLLGLFASYPAAAHSLLRTGVFEGGEVRIALCAPPAAAQPGESAPEEAAAAAPSAADPALVALLDARAGYRNPRLALAQLPTKLAVTALAGEKVPAPPAAPGFARGSAAAAQRGTAIHLFMQCADYARAARSAQDELDRLVRDGYIAASDAAGIDVAALDRLFASEFGQWIAAAPRVLREYDFIDSIPASALAELPPPLAQERVMIQGIADCVVLEPDGAVLVDYKSDRVRTPQELAARYTEQLRLYKYALDRRLEKPVKRCVLYSFALGRPVELAL